MWCLLASALAASPGGFRMGPELPVRSVELREALQIDGSPVSQTTVAAQTSLAGRFSLSAEVPLVVSASPELDAGVGVMRLGGATHFGFQSERIFTLGVEVGFQWVPNAATAQSWATVKRDTIPAGEALAYGAIAVLPDTPVQARLGVGFRSGPYESIDPYSDLFFLAEFGLVGVIPVRERFSVVLEGELMVDPTPLSGRTLARLDFDALTLDAGVQLSIPMRGAVRGGVLLAVRRFF